MQKKKRQWFLPLALCFIEFVRFIEPIFGCISRFGWRVACRRGRSVDTNPVLVESLGLFRRGERTENGYWPAKRRNPSPLR